MKIIDLLNKISNGEEVPNFIVDEVEYYMGENGYLRECMGGDTQWYIDKEWLNTKVEILEEKKIPEKLHLSDYEDITGKFDYDVLLIINEIIDYLDYLKSKGDK